MNRVFPLQQFPLRERTPMHAMLSVFFIAWIVMLFASANAAPGVSSGIRFVLEVSFALAVAIGTVQMKALARAREVLGAHPLPHVLWRTWLHACIAETSLTWALLAAAMALLLASPGSNLPWPGAVALLSSGLATGALCVLAQHSMVPKKVGWLVNAVAVAVLFSALYFGNGRVLAWFAGLPLPMLSLLALSWPVVAGVLTLHLRRQPGAGSDAPTAKRTQWLATAAKRMRRYSPLHETWTRQSPTEQATARSRKKWMVRGVLYGFVYSLLTPLRWGQEPDLRHLLSLAMLCMITSQTLVARDLHWRWLLVPGGWRAGRIASDIFATNLKLYFASIAAVVLVTAVLARLFTGMDALAVIDVAASHVLVLAEISFALSAALVLRVLPHRSLWAYAAGAIFIGLWIYSRTIGATNLWKAPAAGSLYAIALVAGTFAILRVADRLWTNEKLTACARGAA